MSTTAAKRINAIKGQIEHDLRILTHPEDRAAYVKELRDQLSRINAATKRSPHDKHTNEATDDFRD